MKCNLMSLVLEKAFKEKRNISLADIQRETGVSKTRVSKFYHDAFTVVYADDSDKLCRWLHCQPGDLFTFEEGE